MDVLLNWIKEINRLVSNPHKKETESKMENPTHVFGEANLVL